MAVTDVKEVWKWLAIVAVGIIVGALGDSFAQRNSYNAIAGEIDRLEVEIGLLQTEQAAHVLWATGAIVEVQTKLTGIEATLNGIDRKVDGLQTTN